MAQVRAGTAGALPRTRALGPGGTWRLARGLGLTGLAVILARRPVPAGPLLQTWAAGLLKALRIRVVVEGPLPPAQLWVSNHLSWVDPLVFLSLRPMGVLAKRDVASYPGIGRASRRLGLRFVDREDPLHRAAALVGLASEFRAGRDMLLFPEGTTTHGRHLARVHLGGLLAAHRLGVRTLPFRLSCEAARYPWTGDASLLPHLRELAAGPPLEVRLRPGELLDPRELPDPFDWVHRARRSLAPWEAPHLEPSI